MIVQFWVNFILRYSLRPSLLPPRLPELLQKIHMVLGTDARHAKGVGGTTHSQNQIFVIDLEALVDEHFLAGHNFIFQVQASGMC